MSSPQEEFQKFLADQRAEYKSGLPGKMAEIRALWHEVNEHADVVKPMKDLERMAHTLAGTAGTLGFRDVGTAAKALELLVEHALEAGADLTLTQRSEIAQAIDTLQVSLPAA
ncbi:MAG TPA: Hpt domain-containing protein [Polaromonas sp.]|uniref:Hpt domain-containing protein n=1 Tax=Polaromonas sp. TaxID=1869339 RepID=UPI002D5E58B1|nr:Hpt domain-containing protein [Polaromonas sp.]HYW58639.1 Hpt domain-containing protein [Polaromonas sp.]